MHFLKRAGATATSCPSLAKKRVLSNVLQHTTVLQASRGRRCFPLTGTRQYENRGNIRAHRPLETAGAYRQRYIAATTDQHVGSAPISRSLTLYGNQKGQGEKEGQMSYAPAPPSPPIPHLGARVALQQDPIHRVGKFMLLT